MFFLPSPPQIHVLETQVQPGEAPDPTRQTCFRQVIFETFFRENTDRSSSIRTEVKTARRGKIQISFFQQKHAGTRTRPGETCSSDISQAQVKTFR